MIRTILYLVLLAPCLAINSYASPPTAPTITLTVINSHVRISWKSLSDATGYQLFYAPYPDAATIHSLDMGLSLSFEADLPQSAAFYVAVQAYNVEGNSDYSNIEYFDTSNPQLPLVVSVSPEASSDGVETASDIIITFNEAMDSSAITASGSTIFTVKQTYFDFTISGNISSSNDNKTFTFDPHQPLEVGKEYEGIVSTRASDINGNLLSETWSWKFTVGSLPIADFALPFDRDDMLIATINPFGPIRRSSDSGIGHGGIDIPLPENAPFYAVTDAVIVSVEEGSGGRGGNDVMLLLRTDGVTSSGWYFEYEHITLEPGIGVGTQLTRNQQFARNPGTAANNHLELGYWNGNFTFSKKCWVDFLSSADFLNYFNNSIRTDSDFIDSWTTVQQEGFYPFKGFLDSEQYPGGAQLCYELRTDVRIPVN